MSLQHLVFAAALLAALSQTAGATVINGYASMGASESEGNAYTGSWVPYLANQRGFNFGGAGNPYNVAIGGNDFFAVGTSIADGSLSGPALTTWAQGIVANIDTAVDTVLSAGPLGMVVASMPDILLTPGGRSVFITPEQIARGTAAVDLVNSLLKAEMLSRGVVYVDLTSAMRDINQAPLVVGGVPIDVVNASSDPTHFFQDLRHPAAVGNGLVANLFLEAVNVGFGTTYPILTDLEILTRAGLAGSYTGQTSNLPYENYIITAVPEPSTLVLAGIAALGVLGVRRRLRVA